MKKSQLIFKYWKFSWRL